MEQSIPVLLLKTRSQPHDAYVEYFSSNDADSTSVSSKFRFRPCFVPVLEHRPNVENLARLEHLLKSGTLRDTYGGMIFTSQRAVEGWADVVKRVERDLYSEKNSGDDEISRRNSWTMGITTSDFPFPIYTVGPATSRALATLVAESSSSISPSHASSFSALNPKIRGEQTGNGAALAKYILHHYNLLHSHLLFTFYEAPRLPFIPLIGPPQGPRIEKDDERLRKKPLLFLVGDVRRDIIPKTLMDTEEKLAKDQRITVDEVEVYSTDVMDSFERDFKTQLDIYSKGMNSNVVDATYKDETVAGVVVIVVFSPQGCEAMLRSLAFIDNQNKPTQKAKSRWATGEGPTSLYSPSSSSKTHAENVRYVVASIGPTTRDYLKAKFAFNVDVCASKPTPEGVGEVVKAFLSQKGLLL